MGYDKKSFLTGLAVGRNLRSYPMLEASEYNVAVNVFYTNSAWPCELSTDVPTNYIKMGYFNNPLWGDITRIIKYFLWYDTTAESYKHVLVWQQGETGVVDWRVDTNAYYSETEYNNIGFARIMTYGTHVGDWWYFLFDCPVLTDGQLITQANLSFTGTQSDLEHFLESAEVVTIGTATYIVGRGS